MSRVPDVKYFRVSNMHKYKHYGNRSSPWVKLHSKILTDPNFAQLEDASKAHLMLLLLIAVREDNILPWLPEWISGQVGAKETINLEEMERYGFIEVISDSDEEQVSVPERKPERKQDIPRIPRAKVPATPDPFAASFDRDLQKFEAKLKEVYPYRTPKHTGQQGWPEAIENARALHLNDRISYEDMLAAVARYKSYCECEAVNNIGTQFVMKAANFFKDPENVHNPWDKPKTQTTKADVTVDNEEFFKRKENKSANGG